MPTPLQNSKKVTDDLNSVRFPDRKAFDTIEEYRERVRRYWEAIDAYREMAIDLHNDIMKGKVAGPHKNEEGRTWQDNKGKIS
jgi:hypothetical protein